MGEAEEVLGMIFITDYKTPEVMHPSKQAFNTPSLGISTQWPAVLSFGSGSVDLVRRNYFDTILLKVPIKRIAVIRSITDESLRSSLKEALLESLSNKGDFMWASRRNVDGERKTRAICHCHELRTLAPLGFSDTGAPFFATTKVASMKHSERSNLPRPSRSSASVSRTGRKALDRIHSWNRR
jgi:hypothetical protein